MLSHSELYKLLVAEATALNFSVAKASSNKHPPSPSAARAFVLQSDLPTPSSGERRKFLRDARFPELIVGRRLFCSAQRFENGFSRGT